MRRPWRWLFNLAAGVSLVLFVAVTAMWVRSYFARDVVGGQYNTQKRPATSYRLLIDSGSGTLKVDRTVVRDGAGTAALPLDPNSLSAPGWYWDLDSMSSNSSRRWEGERDLFILWGFGMSEHNADVSDWLVHGRVTTPQPAPIVAVRGRAIWMPYPVLVLGLAVLPWLRWRQYRREAKRARAGTCATCGYDLRATPDRCPECGAVPAP